MIVKDCIVLLAGLGTRCYPFSYVVPKCMVPIVNKPVIEYIVDELVSSGIERMYFVLPKFANSKICIEHFKPQKQILKLLKEKKSPYYEKMASRRFPQIIPIYSKKPNGSGGAVLDCEKYLKGKTFAVVNGDDLFLGEEPALAQLIDISNKKDGLIIGSKIVPVEENYKYGMVKYDDNTKVISIIEKPKNDNVLTCANVGRYILNDKIFECLKQTSKKNGEIFLTDAIDRLAQTEDIYCEPIKAKRYDCGSAKGLVEANNDFAKLFL